MVDQGRVVAQHAFAWRDGQMYDLGTLGGRDSEARAINAAGHIVGMAQTASGEAHATLWRTIHPEEVSILNVEIRDAVETGELAGSEAAPLLNMIRVVTAMLNDGRVKPAIRQLEAFVRQVEALVRRHALTEAGGQELIDAARGAIAKLQATP
jgi:hypothetical protein